MIFKLCCVFLILLYQSEGSVILDYLRLKNIPYISVFSCGNIENDMLDMKLFSKFGIRYTYNRYYKENIQEQYYKSAVILNGSCENWTQSLEIMNSMKYKIPQHWLIFSKNLSETIDVLTQYPIEVDSDFTISLEVQINYYDLYEIYNSGFYTNGNIIIGKRGYWNKSELVMEHTKRMNMSGVILKCMVVVTQALMKETFEEYLDRSSQTAVDSLHKLKYFTLLKYLQDMYKFSYKLHRTNSWGYVRNGSFDGMAGALQRQEVDLGGSPVFMRADRAMFLDYTIQTWESRPCFMFRHPKRSGAFYTTYTRPLDDNVWFCTLLFLFLVIIMLYLMLRSKWMIPEEAADSTLSLVALSILGTICQQGMNINRRSSATRIVIFSTLVFSVTLYQFYNASIVSTLLRKPPKNIRNLEDLLNSPLKAGVENVLYNIDYFKRTTDTVAHKLYQKKIIHDGVKNILTPSEGMALVKLGGYAFHVDSPVGYRIIRETFTERETCELQEVQLYPPQRMIAVVRKGLPYREIITYGLRKMSESGLMHRLKVSRDEPKPKCINTPDSSVFTVNIHDFSMALVVLISGVVSSMVILIIEIFVYNLFGRK